MKLEPPRRARKSSRLFVTTINSLVEKMFDELAICQATPAAMRDVVRLEAALMSDVYERGRQAFINQEFHSRSRVSGAYPNMEYPSMRARPRSTHSTCLAWHQMCR